MRTDNINLVSRGGFFHIFLQGKQGIGKIETLLLGIFSYPCVVIKRHPNTVNNH